MNKKIILSSALFAALGLTGCLNDSNNEENSGTSSAAGSSTSTLSSGAGSSSATVGSSSSLTEPSATIDETNNTIVFTEVEGYCEDGSYSESVSTDTIHYQQYSDYILFFEENECNAIKASGSSSVLGTWTVDEIVERTDAPSGCSTSDIEDLITGSTIQIATTGITVTPNICITEQMTDVLGNATIIDCNTLEQTDSNGIVATWTFSNIINDDVDILFEANGSTCTLALSTLPAASPSTCAERSSQEATMEEEFYMCMLNSGFSMEDGSDSTDSSDVCSVMGYYNDGICDTECAEPDPDCTTLTACEIDNGGISTCFTNIDAETCVSADGVSVVSCSMDYVQACLDSNDDYYYLYTEGATCD